MLNLQSASYTTFRAASTFRGGCPVGRAKAQVMYPARLGGSPRAFGAWPPAWPSPSGPLGWQRLRGQRRAAGASRAAGCEAPLRPEGPTRTMRGVPAPAAVTFCRPRRILRDADRLAVVLAGSAAGYGGDRRRPVTGGAVRGSRRARRAAARKGASGAADPRRRDPG